MTPRGQPLQRPGIAGQQSQTGSLVNNYMVGPQTQSPTVSQQQMLVNSIRLTKSIVGAQSSQNSLNNKQLLEQQKRLLLQQSHQQLVPQSQQPDNCTFPDNIKELLNSSVVPNAQITMKPRQTSAVQQQDNSSQLSPCYVPSVGNNAAMQVPSTPVLPQSPVAGSQLSPGPGNTPTAALRTASYSPAAHPQSNTVYASPQTTSASSPFSSNNRMSPGHFMGNNNVTVASSSSASPSPAPPVSPLVQQIASPQQSTGQPMTPITWQQQVSPANSTRLSSNVPSPQVMSPSSTSTSTLPHSATNLPPNGMVSLQQKTNPMLNAQLSGMSTYHIASYSNGI